MIEIEGLILRPSVMAEQFARFDWSATPLGPIAGWPDPLRVSAQLCLDSPLPMTVGWGADYLMIYNDGYIPILGSRHPDALGRPAMDVYGELADFIGPILKAAFERGEAYAGRNVLLPMTRHDRLEEGYFDIWYNPIRDARGGIRGVMATADECTEQMVAQRRQRTVIALAERFVDLPADQPLLPHVIDVAAENPEDLASVALFEVMGGQTVVERFASAEAFSRRLQADGVVDLIKDRIRAGLDPGSRVERLDARRFLVTFVRPELLDTSGHLVVIEPAPTVKADADLLRFLDVLRELITGALYRVRTERAALADVRRQLDDRDRLYRMLFEHTAEGVAIAHPDGTLVAVNPAACRLLDYSEAEILALGYRGTIVNDDGSLDRALESLAAHGHFDGEMRLRTKAGGVVLTDTASVLTRDAESGNERIITLLRDAAPRVQTQERVTATARLEALGQLTGGISHDFNNLLNVIINGAEELTEVLPAERLEHESASLILAASLRAADLTRQLLAFSQQRPSTPERLLLSDALAELEQLLARVLGSGIEVQVTVGADAEVLVDATLLSSSLLNLCINARDAMPDGGALTITQRRRELGKRAAEKLLLTPAMYAEVTVRDTGAGIPRELLDRVIEPYFTTKPVGQGSGLGLAMVYGFMRQCGGAMGIRSEEGQGTCVTLYFPLANEAVEPSTASSSAAGDARAGAGQHILIVEDNDLLAGMLRNILQRAGYRVSHCGEAESALDVIAAEGSVDLVITDILLGKGLNGWQLAERIEALEAPLPVITMSGFAPDSANPGARQGGRPNLSKPFRPREALELIARVLAEA